MILSPAIAVSAQSIARQLDADTPNSVRRFDAGLCKDCNNPRMVGRTRCPTCAHARRMRLRKPPCECGRKTMKMKRVCAGCEKQNDPLTFQSVKRLEVSPGRSESARNRGTSPVPSSYPLTRAQRKAQGLPVSRFNRKLPDRPVKPAREIEIQPGRDVKQARPAPEKAMVPERVAPSLVIF